MADIIKLLPDTLANQIAAGEVVQRPASVVKELLENAIDAGATKISLIIKDGGKTWIQVIDNGAGMSETDARLCFERHATSKLKVVEDLFNIQTMGFRGEALASIAAVAQVELKTKREEDTLGTRILIENSTVVLQEPCQAPKGTQIIVKNLFFNVPARKNFLKADSREQSIIQDEFIRIALACPDIAFDFFIDDRPVYKLIQSNLKQRITNILNKDVSKNLVQVSEETDVIRLYGFVGTPEIAKKRRGDQYFYVNGRYITSYFLNHAVLNAYENILPEGSVPFYAIFLETDPSKIDVNVHPTKQEIKFEDERIIYNYLKVSVRHALATHQIVPSLDFDAQSSFNPFRNATEKNHSGNYGNPISDSGDNTKEQKVEQRQAMMQIYDDLFQKEEKVDSPITMSSAAGADENELFSESAEKRPFQIHKKFIFCHIKSGVLIVDQRAAHERILFEKYLDALSGEGLGVQQELFPRVFETKPVETSLILDLMPSLNQMGFDIQEFGTDSFVIHGTPAHIKDLVPAEEVIMDMVGKYKESTEWEMNSTDRIAAALAKATALKQGRILSVEEMNALIDQLFGCAMPYRAPGGRKCFINLDLEDLDQKFK